MTEQEPQFENNLAASQEDENIVKPEKPNYDPQPVIDVLHNKLREDYIDLARITQNKVISGEFTQEKADGLLNRLSELSKKDLGYELSEHLPLGNNLEKAKELVGEAKFFGPDSVKKAFGTEIESVPNIPFCEVDLKKAKELGQFLVLRTNIAPDGQPLTIEKIGELFEPKLAKRDRMGHDYLNIHREVKGEAFLTTEAPKLQWALTSSGEIPGSSDKNHLEQTEVLADYAKNKVFTGNTLPSFYKEALNEFLLNKDRIRTLIGSDNIAASRELTNLKLNKLTRPSAVEALYDILLINSRKRERILDGSHAWTSTSTSNGDLVHITGDRYSATVGARPPDYSYMSINALFSRTI